MFLARNQLTAARVGPFIWGPLLAAGGAFGTPAYLTIISGRVGPEDQAKAQSLIGFFYSVGAAVGTSVFSTVIFDAGATGHRAALFCYVTAGIYAFTTGIIILTACYDKRNPKPPIVPDTQTDGGKGQPKGLVAEGAALPAEGLAEPSEPERERRGSVNSAVADR